MLSAAVPFAFSKRLSAKNAEYTERIAVFTQKIKEYFSALPTIKNYGNRLISEYRQLHVRLQMTNKLLVNNLKKTGSRSNAYLGLLFVVAITFLLIYAVLQSV